MPATTAANTVIVGAGQAGLAVSYHLSKLSQDHVVLEQADQPGEAWRDHRWDSFTLNTPRWQSRSPGVQYGEDDPDGFMPKQEVVASFIADRIAERCNCRDDSPGGKDASLQPNLMQAETPTSTPRARHLGKTILTMARIAVSAAAFALSPPSE